jgi:hypothetical protein
MNDFILTEIAREYHARVNRQAEAARMAQAADGSSERQRVRRRRIRPRNG